MTQSEQGPVERILRLAAEYVERGWTQQVGARDADGKWTLDPDTAVCWCASAALACATREVDGSYRLGGLYTRAYGFMQTVTKHRIVSRWNDAKNRTAADVIRAFGAAADLASKEGK